MRHVVATIAVLFPFNAFACDAMDDYLNKWKLTGDDVVYETVDHTQRIPVYVFDMQDRTEPDQRYAVVWYDQKTCTVEAEYRDLRGMLYIMEADVYERTE